MRESWVARWMLEWKSWEGQGEGRRWKKGSGSETIFDCVAFSLSRLFRDDHRQCSTQRGRFFRRRFLKKKEEFSRTLFRSLVVHPPFALPSPCLLYFLCHFRSVASLCRDWERNWNEVTKCQYYVIGFLPRLVFYLGTEFRAPRIHFEQRDFANLWDLN